MERPVDFAGAEPLPLRKGNGEAHMNVFDIYG